MTERKSIFDNIIVRILMCIIIVAFLFTGVQTCTNNSNKVATVDDKIVSPTEFNRALQANLEDISKRNGGKYPTQKQIRDLGIQNNIIDQLVSQKILLRFAENTGFNAGKEDIKNTIINQYAAFKTNNQFDLIKYKNILKLNGIQVKDFERDVIDQIKVNRLNAMFAALYPSDKYLAEQAKMRNSEAIVNAISFDKEQMANKIAVSNTEVEAFLKDEIKANAVIDSLYKSYLESNSDTKPKKKADLKTKLAKEHIQKTKRDELKSLNAKIKTELEANFKSNNWNGVTSLAKKYGLNFKKSQTVSLLNPRIPGVTLNDDEFTKNVAKKNTSDVLINDTALAISLVKIQSFKTKKVQKDDPYAQFAKFSQSRSLSFKAIDYQRQKSDIKKYNIVLQ